MYYGGEGVLRWGRCIAVGKAYYGGEGILTIGTAY